MEVLFDGLRADDSPGELKVVGWGNMAQELQEQVRIGQKLILEGRLRMNTITRQDGTKEKRAEFTLSRLHPISNGANGSPTGSKSNIQKTPMTQRTQEGGGAQQLSESGETNDWNSSPLIPDTDEIPF